MVQILIDAPGAGEWVMHRVTGVFSPGYDHSFSLHRDGEIVGGFAVCSYLGNSATIHMAGADEHWCTRDLLWLVFDYTFNQLGLGKLIGLVRSDNYRTLSIDLRGGWQIETLVRDLYEPGVHCFVLQMTRETCPWLRIKPRAWRATIGDIVSLNFSGDIV